ncbi:MAG TPA: hypothetical protein VJJ76_01375, partial [archaeon]|nr:hypothetical protein [archaeon]
MEKKRRHEINQKIISAFLLSIFFGSSFGQAVVSQLSFPLGQLRSKFTNEAEMLAYLSELSPENQYKFLNSSLSLCSRTGEQVFNTTIAQNGNGDRTYAHKFSCFVNNVQEEDIELKVSVADRTTDFLGYVASNGTAMKFDKYEGASLKFVIFANSRSLFNILVSTSSSSPEINVDVNQGKIVLLDTLKDFASAIRNMHQVESILFLRRAYEQIYGMPAGISYSAANVETTDSAVQAVFSALNAVEIFNMLNGESLEKSIDSATFTLSFDPENERLVAKSGDAIAGTADVSLNIVPIAIGPSTQETLSQNQTESEAAKFSLQNLDFNLNLEETATQTTSAIPTTVSTTTITSATTSSTSSATSATTTTTTTAAPSFNSQTTTTTSTTAGTTTNPRIGDESSRAERTIGGISSSNLLDNFFSWLSSLFGTAAKAQDLTPLPEGTFVGGDAIDRISGRISFKEIDDWWNNFWQNIFGSKSELKYSDLVLSNYKFVLLFNDQRIPVSSIEDGENQAIQLSAKYDETINNALYETSLFGWPDQGSKTFYLVSLNKYSERSEAGTTPKFDLFFKDFSDAKGKIVVVFHTHPNDAAYVSNIELGTILDNMKNNYLASEVRFDVTSVTESREFGMTLTKDTINRLSKTFGSTKFEAIDLSKL